MLTFRVKFHIGMLNREQEFRIRYLVMPVEKHKLIRGRQTNMFIILCPLGPYSCNCVEKIRPYMSVSHITIAVV